jgi:hypothetical protein
MRRVIKLFEGETADKTSGAINILGAKKVVLFCKRANHIAGSTTFSAVVGVEGNETAYNKWISNVSNTNTQTETRVSSLVLNTNSCGFLTMDPKDTFETIKVTADVTTDGANSAWLILDY